MRVSVVKVLDGGRCCHFLGRIGSRICGREAQERNCEDGNDMIEKEEHFRF